MIASFAKKYNLLVPERAVMLCCWKGSAERYATIASILCTQETGSALALTTITPDLVPITKTYLPLAYRQLATGSSAEGLYSQVLANCMTGQ